MTRTSGGHIATPRPRYRKHVLLSRTLCNHNQATCAVYMIGHALQEGVMRLQAQRHAIQPAWNVSPQNCFGPIDPLLPPSWAQDKHHAVDALAGNSLHRVYFEFKSETVIFERRNK